MSANARKSLTVDISYVSYVASENFRVVQLTPPGSECPIINPTSHYSSRNLGPAAISRKMKSIAVVIFGPAVCF